VPMARCSHQIMVGREIRKILGLLLTSSTAILRWWEKGETVMNAEIRIYDTPQGFGWKLFVAGNLRGYGHQCETAEIALAAALDCRKRLERKQRASLVLI
jgi:hypothetical protein